MTVGTEGKFTAGLERELGQYIAMIGMLRRDVADDIAKAILTDQTSPLHAVLAAAPEMFEALKGLLDNLYFPFPESEKRPFVLAARAALAKTLGQTEAVDG